MDLMSRVEYALSLNLRASPSFGFGDAYAVALRATASLFPAAPLPPGGEDGGGGGSSEGGAWRVVVFDDGGGRR